MNKFVKHLIISKIKGLSTQIKQARQEIYASSRSKKIDSSLPFVKLRLGEEARYQNLAYAFLRGVPYSVAENKCADNNKVSAKRLYDTVTRNIEFSYDWPLAKRSTEENVGKWLAGEVIDMTDPRIAFRAEKIDEAKARLATRLAEKSTKQQSIPAIEKVLKWLTGR